MELLTQSKYRAFRGCPRYFYNRHERGLVPRIESDGRRRGTIFGSCIFAVQQADEDGTLDRMGEDGDTVRRAIENVILATTDEFYASFHPSSQEEQDEMEVERVKVEQMALAYIGRYGIDKRREVLFDMPLINPQTGHPSRTFRRAGKIDGLTIIGQKRARVIEDKFVGQIQKVMIDRLPLDQQIAEYVDALAQQGWTGEVEYRHTLYPGINPKGPKEFKTKDNYPGESLDEFADRLKADILDRDEHYFDVQRLVYDQAALERHRAFRWRTGQDIMRARRELPRVGLDQAFPQHEWKCNQYGSCEFIPLCTAREGADALYRQEIDNPELQRG